MIDLSDKRFCYFIPADGLVKEHGYRVSIVVEGEAGHFPTGDWPYEGKVDQRVPWFWGMDYEGACQIAKAQNAKLGLTEEDVFKIINSSVVGRLVPEPPRSRARTRVRRQKTSA